MHCIANQEEVLGEETYLDGSYVHEWKTLDNM